jgi:BTB/POZ domain
VLRVIILLSDARMQSDAIADAISALIMTVLDKRTTPNSGRRFLTSRQTITQHDNSMLAAMFREDSSFRRVEDESGYCFLDRDGERFPHVLNYLRCVS